MKLPFHRINRRMYVIAVCLLVALTSPAQHNSSWSFVFEINSQQIPSNGSKAPGRPIAFLLDSATSLYKTYNIEIENYIDPDTKVGFSAGIKYSQQVKGNLAVEIGVQVSNNSFEIKSGNIWSKTDSANLVLQGTAFGLYDPQTGVYYSQSISGGNIFVDPGGTPGSFFAYPTYKVNLTRIDFPLGAAYKIPSTKFYIAGKIIPSFIIRSVVDYTDGEISLIDPNTKVNTSLLWHTGIGINYAFTEKLSMGLTYNHPFNQIEAAGKKTKIRAYGISLAYAFKKKK
ncbi:MAG: PorT family protein [Chitinophagaceae bacterium]|nr:MAG: PorT family protein [Chitinophagaceae bacterium]